MKSSKYLEQIKKYLQESKGNGNISRYLNDKERELKLYSAEFHSYDSIIKKTVKLCNELNISDSLQLSFFFNFLLLHGYFSEDKIFYAIDVLGDLPLDVMLGYASGTQISIMLADFLKQCGYFSVPIGCDILQGFSEQSNRTLTAIGDNGFYYYDLVNKNFYSGTSEFYANSVLDNSKARLKGNVGIDYIKSKSDFVSLVTYMDKASLVRNLDIDELDAAYNFIREVLKSNLHLIGDFRECIKDDVEFIASALSRKRN